MATPSPELHGVPVPSRLESAAIAACLSPAEGSICAAFGFDKRRTEWLAGRLAAKQLVQARHAIQGPDALRMIEIGNVADGPERGRPFYRIGGGPGPFPLSISHSGRLAIAALARRADDRVGVDIEHVEYRESSFETVALSESERHDLSGFSGLSRWRAVTRIWVLKEALLKAIGVGLHVPLTQVTVRGNHQAPCGAWSFQVAREARARFQALSVLGTRHVVVSTFEMGECLGAWVVIPGEAHS
ncbi:MAG: 4'-phosphopantetheinyl transferase superfamily protein [Vicinamibacterales bacterium]